MLSRASSPQNFDLKYSPTFSNRYIMRILPTHELATNMWRSCSLCNLIRPSICFWLSIPFPVALSPAPSIYVSSTWERPWLRSIQKTGKITNIYVLIVCIAVTTPDEEIKLQNYTVDIASVLQAGRNGVRIPAGTRDFFLLQNVQTGSGAHRASYLMGTEALSRGKRNRSVKLTTHLHLEARLRISGGIPPLSHIPSRYGTG